MSPVLLGIETSCDETSAAVVRGRKVLSNVISSQIDLHKPYSGVVPELASRAHCERIGPVVREALVIAFGARAADKPLQSWVDAIAFTRGPGLAGALLVGKVAAEALARASGLPLVGVNHLEAHALAMDLEASVKSPFLALVVSGGHTELISVRGPGLYRVLGRTRDDAAGEVFDKVAKLLRLGYPGGPVVDALARSGNAEAIAFPRALLPGSWDFSFSGLKTAVLYHVRDAGYLGTGRVRPGDPVLKKPPKRFTADVCASFQEAVVDTLIEKTIAAAHRLRVRSIVLGGGVAANSRLRAKLKARAGQEGLKAFFPPLALCTDNAAMIAYAGGLRIAAGKFKRTRAVDPALLVRTWA
ncbi:MAG: tRNA (adenosine(37)-N6)-threonylcarbamoyltransferase complex transferase subunit TsaD [Elusimicrobia bacterium]|nr:MAG: tRNA (adenosine(37)-N6)-threonylcarbamoyltransferase complex transferase subunit TsaD [Elusimicrobiota bacterium]